VTQSFIEFSKIIRVRLSPQENTPQIYNNYLEDPASTGRRQN
jgi:hypothetical protein